LRKTGLSVRKKYYFGGYMKRILFGLVFLCELAMLAVYALSSYSCSTAPGGSSSTGAVVNSISGMARFTTTTGNPTPQNVKLCARFTHDAGATYTIVSDVTNIGTTPNTDVDFKLTIDFGSITPANNDSITLWMWVDVDNDNVIDGGDGFAFPAKPNNAGGNCPVFGTSGGCALAYAAFFGSWCVVKDNNPVSINSAVTTGAKITSNGDVWN
jgi:hypothetical protein